MKKLLLLISDAVVLYGALVFALLLRYGPAQWSARYADHIVPFSILFLVWILSFYIAGLYEERTLRNGRDFYQRLSQAITIGAGLSILFFYLIPYFVITPKTNLFIFIVVFAILESGVRFVFNQLIAGGAKKRLLIIGVDDESLELARFVTDNPQFGYTISGLVRLGQESLPNASAIPWRVIDDLSGIEDFIRGKHIDTVVISPRAYGMDRVITALYRTLAEQVNFASLSGFTERLTGTVPIAAIRGVIRIVTPQDAVHRLEHDLYYIKHRSLAMDLEIILKTITTVLRAVGQ